MTRAKSGATKKTRAREVEVEWSTHCKPWFLGVVARASDGQLYTLTSHGWRRYRLPS